MTTGEANQIMSNFLELRKISSRLPGETKTPGAKSRAFDVDFGILDDARTFLRDFQQEDYKQMGLKIDAHYGKIDDFLEWLKD